MKIVSRDIKAGTIVKWLIAVALFVLIAVFMSAWAAVAFGLFALGLMLDVDPVFPFGASLILLVVCTLLVLLSQKEAAKMLAIWAFSFLAIGVGLQFYHYIKAGPEGDGEAGE